LVGNSFTRLYCVAAAILASAVTGGTVCGPATASTVPSPVAARSLAATGSADSINWGKPVFTDNFSGTSLGKVWSIYNDPQPKPPRPRRTVSSVKVREGSLELIGHYEKPYGYVSGGISYNVNQLYGRWIVRFRADAGAGYAPVVLLWPKGPWPADGEIDVAEVGNVHRRGAGENIHLATFRHFVHHQIPPSVDFTKWHTMAVDWLPDHITFWLDGKPQWTVKRAVGDKNYIPSTPFHLALQNDQGCDTGCKTNKSTPPQVIMRVDWVKIYAGPSAQAGTVIRDPGSKGVRAVAYSPDGRYLAAADANGHAYLWTAPGSQLHSTLTDPSGGVTAVAFSPDSSALAAGDRSGRVYLSGAGAFRPLGEAADSAVTRVAFSADGRDLAAADADGRTYVRSATTGQTSAVLTDPGSQGVRGLAYSPDGKYLATADGNGHVSLWTVPGYQLYATLADPDSRGVNGVAFTTRSHYLAAADANGRTYVWTVATGKVLAVLADPASQGVRGVAYSPDGTMLAAADTSGRTSIWELPDYKLRTTLANPGSGGVTAVAFNQTSATVAAADANGSIYLYRTGA
jgi:beta-glucanase (GH16 family)